MTGRLPLRAVRAVPALCLFACSWYLSSLPAVPHMPRFWGADKLVHCACFAALAFCVALALPRLRLRCSLAAAIVSVYGIIDEAHQGFVPGRSCSAADWLFDTIGAALGAAAFLLAVRLLSRRREAR